MSKKVQTGAMGVKSVLFSLEGKRLQETLSSPNRKGRNYNLQASAEGQKYANKYVRIID